MALFCIKVSRLGVRSPKFRSQDYLLAVWPGRVTSSSSQCLWFFRCKSLNFFCLFPFLFKGDILSSLFQPSVYKEVQNPFLFYVSKILQAKRMTILTEFIINLNTVRIWLCAPKVNLVSFFLIPSVPHLDFFRSMRNGVWFLWSCFWSFPRPKVLGLAI